LRAPAIVNSSTPVGAEYAAAMASQGCTPMAMAIGRDSPRLMARRYRADRSLLETRSMPVVLRVRYISR
jgi:hypothetical protein